MPTQHHSHEPRPRSEPPMEPKPSWGSRSNEREWKSVREEARHWAVNQFAKRGISDPAEPFDFDAAEPALAFGYGAYRQYGAERMWDDELESVLEGEWSGLRGARSWDEARQDVRRGWDFGRQR